MATSTHARRRAERRGETDRGTTLIELLIAIVLIGGVVAGTMATLRATTIAGTMHRDHSNAHGWLQSASDVLYAAPRTDCNPALPDKGEANTRTAYKSIVNGVTNPQGFADWQIQIVPKVQFWNSGNIDSDPDVEFFFGPDCDPNLTLQLIKIEVRNKDSQIIESVEIVK